MKRITIIRNLIYLSLSITILSCNNKILTKKQSQIERKDSITLWLKGARNPSFSKAEQKNFLHKAYGSLQTNTTDSSTAKNLSIIAYRFYELKDTISFQKINTEAQKLAYQQKDSFTIADTHWSLADYYNNKKIFNSSYFHYNKAYEYFNNINREYETARMLYAMAYIKGNYRDYSGSEILTFKAIEKFKSLKNYKYLYTAYNHLATLQTDIKRYNKAIDYYQKAKEYASKVKGSKKTYYKAISNNLGIVYMYKKEYKNALIFFNESLKNTTRILDSTRVIDNIAYTKLLMNDTIGIKKSLIWSLRKRDSIKDKPGRMASNIHISDYYKYIQDTAKAISHAKQAKQIAIKIKNSQTYLKSLKKLAELEPNKSKQYLDRYIQFNDSLVNAERQVQNKFTRIAFETDEFIEENKRLSQQTIFISVTGVGLILILSLLYFIRIQKTKNEKLLLESEQQKANEEIYILTLQQQAALEKEKVNERNRISQELHDGILGKLFGTRMGLGFLDIKGTESTQEKHQSLLDELQQIEKEIRDVSHQLNTNFNSAQINFTSLIKQLALTKAETAQFEIQFSFDEQIAWDNISEIIKVNVYRVIQEALMNVVKYANAKNVSLAFSTNTNDIKVVIKDDGVGFDTGKKSKGIGIKNIRSRIKKLNGVVEIESKLSVGTTIEIQIPINE
ncbi:MAG: sensor histidine kinase [Flavobacteriaceae bacterium]|nr:sensor histidine kinase [Flavobacteriaceae bacterium]